MAELSDTQELEWEYAGIHPQTVHDCFIDRELFLEMRRAGGDEISDLEIEVRDGVSVITCNAVNPARLPAFARPLVPKGFCVQVQIVWVRQEGGYLVRYSGRIGKRTGLVTGEAQVFATPEGSRVRERFTTTVSFPLFRRRILKHIKAEFRKMMASDFANGLRLLQRRMSDEGKQPFELLPLPVIG